MKNIISTILKGISIALGVILLAVSGFMGLENLQAPRTINIPIMLFSLAGIFLGSIILWLTFRKPKNM